MTNIAVRIVLFADLRGSTGLFESMGNTQATHVVTSSVGGLCSAVTQCGGSVVKTLGDGLMASFGDAAAAVRAADAMHEALEHPALQAGDQAAGLAAARPVLKLQIALARGEVVEVDNDSFGDAVNVAARLLDHAGDNEILATAEVVDSLSDLAQHRFRSLSRIQLRGRAEAVHVFLLSPRRGHDFAATTLLAAQRGSDPEGIRLTWLEQTRVFAPTCLPVMLGRSPQATYCIDDTRVSRMHARIDWHGGTFQLLDMSFNGSFVCFDHDTETVTLKRGRCTLHGSGAIGLGSPPLDASTPTVRFDVMRFADTEPLAGPGSW